MLYNMEIVSRPQITVMSLHSIYTEGHKLLHTEVKKVKASHTRYQPSIGPGADPGVKAVSPQVTIIYKAAITF